MRTKKVLLENCYDIVVGDTETLGRWDDAIVLSVAMTYGDLREPLTLQQLIEERTFFMKFDVREQIQLGRKVEMSTKEWWNSEKVTEEAKKMSYYPDPSRDQSIRLFRTEYESWAHQLGFEPVSTIHTDRNLFDFRKLQHIIEVTLGEKHHPWSYHDVEDITTRLKAYCGDRYGNMDIRKMVNVVYHDPRYDAAVDWLRLQSVAVQIGLLEIDNK